MQFADYAKIYVTAGDGGAGAVHFRREKFVPRGGPDGGDGGDGGNVVLVGNEQLNTLLDLRYRKFVKAEHGDKGGKNNKKGKSGDDERLEVPLGTVIFEDETRRRIGEITEHGQELLLARGGKGGKGNTRFKSSTNQAPRKAESGGKGKHIVVELELKLISDVGLVGFPNAGKSTLLSALSGAKPKIAHYPFTTLQPNLGVVQFDDFRSFVMADIPGIIEEAHEGKGLGIQFLRHIERNNLLLFVISSQADIQYEYEALLNELKEYRKDLLEKPRLVAISKMDLIEGYELDQEYEIEVPVVQLSAATDYNMDELKEAIWKELQAIEQEKDS